MTKDEALTFVTRLLEEISERFTLEDIVGEDALREWASENGYVKSEE